MSDADRLHALGLRATKPRLAILDVLAEARAGHEHLAASDIEARVRTRAGAVSTQAVYDSLDALTLAGLARRIEPAGHPARYETRVGDNHHHVVCRACGAVADVDCATGEAPCLEASNDAGYVIDEAEVTYWGLCPQCQTHRATGGLR